MSRVSRLFYILLLKKREVFLENEIKRWHINRDNNNEGENSMKMERKRFILEGEIYRVILTLALPIMFNNFIQTVYNVTDTYFVSKLGGIEVAAITLVWPAIFLLISLTAGINMAGGAIIAQRFGAGRYRRSRNLGGQLIWFSMVFSTVLGIAGYLAAEPLVYSMGGRGKLFTEAVAYFKIISLGTPLTSYSLAFTSIKQGEGDTTTPMILSVISVAINIILDPIFIFTLGFGVKGAAIATLISRGVLCMIAVYLLHIKVDLMRIGIRDILPRRRMLEEIIRKGIPLSIGNSTTAFGFIVLNTFVVRYGAEAMAAFGIGNRITAIIFMPAMGIGGAVTTVVGQNLGGGRVDRIGEAFRKSLKIVTAISIPGTLFMWINAHRFVGYFVDDTRIMVMGEYYLKMISLTIICMGTFQVVVGIFQGISHTKKAMTLNMVRLWGLRIPMIIIFSFISVWGERSIWYAMVVSNFFGATIAIGMYMKTDLYKAAAVRI